MQKRKRKINTIIHTTAKNVTVCRSSAYLHHGGNGMDSVHVLHEAFYEVTYAQTDGPVGVTLQSDHLIGTETGK